MADMHTPPVMSLPALWLLERHSPQEIADAIEIMMDFLNVFAGDVEAEPGTWTEATGPRDHDPGLTDDHELTGDEQDAPWTEFNTRGRHKHTAGGTEPFDRHEDDEDDDPDTGIEDDPLGCDPEEDRCLAGDEMMRSGAIIATGIYGFNYAATGGREIGDADDAENDQMTGNVPMPPVHSLEPNAFNGKREYLGHANLMTSFRANGDSKVRSADSGRLLVTNLRNDQTKPGEPV